jgi:hypothetical protein
VEIVKMVMENSNSGGDVYEKILRMDYLKEEEKSIKKQRNN